MISVYEVYEEERLLCTCRKLEHATTFAQEYRQIVLRNGKRKLGAIRIKHNYLDVIEMPSELQNLLDVYKERGGEPVLPMQFSEVDDWQDIVITVDGQEIKGKFTILRVDHDSLPKGLHAYDIRHGDEGDFMDMVSIENHVLVNHCGTFITGRDLHLPNYGWQIEDYKYV